MDKSQLVRPEMSENICNCTIRKILEEKIAQFLLRIENHNWRWPQIVHLNLQLETDYVLLFINAPPNYVLCNILY